MESTKLCVSCRKVTLLMLTVGFWRPLDYGQTRAAKKQGCRLCALAFDAYAHQICVKGECSTDHCGPLLWRIEHTGPGLRHGMFKLDHAHFGPPLMLAVSQESGLFQDGIITHRETQAANSPRNLNLLRSWFKECCSTHEVCRRGSYSKKNFDDMDSSTIIPLRVIDVGVAQGGSDLPRLVTTNYKAFGRYLTLSHCWGRVTPLRTTAATCEAWHTALPWNQLPKTFQDTIELTRELGERFLWIDSLCIVQDDPADLDAQIELMGAIFEGSYCTIAAVDAKGVDGSLTIDRGLFLSGPDDITTARLWMKAGEVGVHSPGPNEAENIRKARLWLEGRSRDELSDNIYEVIIDKVVQYGASYNRLLTKAWYSRGWVYQERELSRRCIFFTEKGLSWRCNQYWDTENTGIPECRDRPTDYDLETTVRVGDYTYDVSHNLCMLWQHTIENYSATKLTYLSDKDKAIKGLEERLTTRFDAVFHFGILNYQTNRRILHQQLLWKSESTHKRLFGNNPEFRCPTWSWMAINGPVKWNSNELLTQPELLCQIDFNQPTTALMRELCISGPDPLRQTENSAAGPGIMSRAGDKIIGWVVLDTADMPVEIIAAPLIQYFSLDEDADPICVEFLALVKIPRQEELPLDSPGLYNRVGRGRIFLDAYTWLGECQPFEFVVI
ncbi:HET-domain-containing protein [Xylaria sp. FL0043]|nr:HET-domain-containing protein [Xylaria sp. FL0043]